MNHFPYLFKTLDIVNAFIFPKSKKVLELEKMSASKLSGSLPKSELLDCGRGSVFCLFKYRDPYVKELIWEIKYKKNKKLLNSVGEIMFTWINERRSGGTCIIPVPQNKGNVRKRGFNQSVLLAKAIRDADFEKKFLYKNNLVEKIKKTARQNSLETRSKRLDNLIGCFACIEPDFVNGKDFIIIDDVHTTGATIWEIRKVLIANGARQVIGLTVAH